MVVLQLISVAIVILIVTELGIYLFIYCYHFDTFRNFYIKSLHSLKVSKDLKLKKYRFN